MNTITEKHNDHINEIVEGVKYCARSTVLTIPIPDLQQILGKDLPNDSIDINEVNDGDHYTREVKLFDNRIEISLHCYYQAPATKEEIRAEVKKGVRERIATLKANLALIGDRYDMTMEEMMELVEK